MSNEVKTCTKPNCDCVEKEMIRQGTELIKSYPCLNHNKEDLDREKTSVKMEESKVKTAEEILIERSFDSYQDEEDLCLKITLDDGVTAMKEYAQSHITQLETRNNDLLILLEKVKELYVVRNRAGSYQEFYTVREQLEQVLNKK